MPSVSTAPVGHTRRGIPALTGVRIFAAVWVVLFHLRDHIAVLFGPTPIDAVSRAGYLGVDVFFVLSGFIISYQYLQQFATFRRDRYLRFLWARLARIYPLQLATLLGLAVLVAAAAVAGLSVDNAERYDLGGFLLDLTLLRSWVGSSQGWNFPAWSLSAEWFAYVVFPALALVLARPLRTSIRLAVLVALAVASALWVHGLGRAGEDQPMAQPLLRVIIPFALGCVLYSLYRDGVGAGLPWKVLAPVAFLALFGATTGSDLGLRGTLAVVLSGVLVLALAQDGDGPLSRVLASRPVVYGGKISFALYMTHNPVLVVMARLLPVDGLGDAAWTVRAGAFAAYVVVLLGVAALAFHLVEAPAQRVMKAHYPGAPRPVPAGSAAAGPAPGPARDVEAGSPAV